MTRILQSLKKYHFCVVDENDNPITSGLRVSIFIPGSTTATVYADQSETALTNPITSTVFDTKTGQIEFWYGGNSVDIVINDGIGRLVKVEGLTPSQNRIVFDSRLALGGSMGNITGTDLVDASGEMVAYAETVGIDGSLLRVGDVVRIKGQVIADDIATIEELAIRVVFGTETVLETADVTLEADNDAISFDIDLKVLAAGSSGKIQYYGKAFTHLTGVTALATTITDTNGGGVAGVAEDLSGDIDITCYGDYADVDVENESQVFWDVQVIKGVLV